MIIATHPGRHGDIAWSLPTIRCLAQAYGEPIHLRLSAKYGSDGFMELLRAQPYLASVHALEHWQVEETAPISPRAPEMLWASQARAVYHLGYEGWPSPDLPRDVYHRCADLEEVPDPRPELPELDLTTPWITVSYPDDDATAFRAPWTCGFTDEHFELKYGLWALLMENPEVPAQGMLVGSSPRWKYEAPDGSGCSWVTATRWIARSKVFLGCCSALHVLACGLGVPVIMMEPSAARHNDIFFPLGKSGPQVTLVTGVDQLPTWDARHVADAVRQALEGQ